MPKKQLALFAFFDAFGWEILQQHAFLDDILVTKQPLGTVFGYSSTCAPSILTGKLPRDHGHFAFFCYNPDESPFGACRYLRFLPKSLTRRGRVRRLLSNALRRWYGYTGYFQIYSVPFEYLPLFEYSERRDLFEPGGINSGAATVFDYLRDCELPFFLSDWRAGEEANLEATKAALDAGEVAFAYLYLPHLDGVMHRTGTQHPEVEEKIQWYDDQIRDVLDVARRNYDEVRLFVFSDHGMTDIDECCDLVARITALGLRFGVDYAAMYDGTMARFWFLNDLARARIVEALEQEPCGQILSEETLREYGCDFPTNRYGDLFFLLNPGVLLCPSFMSETPMAGMHGYDPDDKDSVAMLGSNCVPEPAPTSLVDLYVLMRAEADRVAGRGA